MKNYKLNTQNPFINSYLQNYSLKNLSGFTLVELLVVFTIISIIFALGFANYRNYSQRQELMKFARKIESDLELAKNYASSGKKDLCQPSIPPNPPNLLDGYSYSYNDVNKTSSISVDCSISGQQPITSETIDLDINLFTVETINIPVQFKPLGQGTNIPFDEDPDTDDKAEIKITRTSNGASVIVTVNISGEIELSETN